MNTFLIAKQQEVADTHTIVNLQGKGDQKYAVSIQFGSKPRRPKFSEGWPSSPQENLERLTESGFILARMVPKCDNCGQMGHTRRKCPEEQVEKEKVVITCVNCNEEGHRSRDCPEARKTGAKACKSCGSEEHLAKDCPDKEAEICRNCGQEGHRARECENERAMQCRNCDEWGHASRECTKPKDWSRVTCENCGEKGHGKKRCTQPPAIDAEADGDASWDNAGAANGGGSGGDWNDGGVGDAAGAWGGDAATTGGW